jgi:hypothetical protein
MEIVPGAMSYGLRLFVQSIGPRLIFSQDLGWEVHHIGKAYTKSNIFSKLGAKHMVCDGKCTMFWLGLWVGR